LLARRVDHRVEVLVLQHPHEAREAKGSARLLRLGLAHCRFEMGEVFDPAALAALLHGPGRRSVLLYPADGANASCAVGDEAATQLVLIDATWRKSLRMLLTNPLLQALPRLALKPAAVSRYRGLRKTRLPSQLSTLEATCAALAMLDGDGSRYVPLLDAFERFVADRVARASREGSPAR
jgi:DTW domain-containing protein YfiP